MPALSVAGTPVKLPGGHTGRPLIQNLGPDDVYFDRSETVTPSTGVKVEVGRDYELPTAPVKGGGPIWLVSSGASDVRYFIAG